MMVYAGIDEAGYGPLFGPLVVARSVFAVRSGPAGPSPPSLWRLLQGSVCRLPADSRDRIAVNDSKALYSPARGMAHLERGVLGFLEHLSLQPETVEELLTVVGFQEADRCPDHPCYAGESRLLPVDLEADRLRRARRGLAQAAERTGVRLQEARAAIVLEDRFNRLVASCGNKALCTWSLVAGHLQAIWDRYGDQRPYVVIDRQGGRIYYLELLARLFPSARLCVLQESPATSRYQISGEGKEMLVVVQVESEQEHLPAAFASMTAKYLRELLMMRFRLFWARHAPGVRPTCGYYGDGKRFLREVEPYFTPLGLRREEVVRCC